MKDQTSAPRRVAQGRGELSAQRANCYDGRTGSNEQTYKSESSCCYMNKKNMHKNAHSIFTRTNKVLHNLCQVLENNDMEQPLK